MSKTLVIGDIHGKIEVVNYFLKDVTRRKVFVGDLLDSFNRSIDDQIACVETMLEALSTRDDVTCLLGNHEQSYTDDRRCSGYKEQTAIRMQQFILDVNETFKLYTHVDHYLVTHAGWSQKYPHDYTHTYAKYDVGLARGGVFPSGGITWCDWDREFVPRDGVPQICGHTAGKGIRINQNALCIDCLDHINQVIEIDNDRIEIVSF